MDRVFNVDVAAWGGTRGRNLALIGLKSSKHLRGRAFWLGSVGGDGKLGGLLRCHCALCDVVCDVVDGC